MRQTAATVGHWFAQLQAQHAQMCAVAMYSVYPHSHATATDTVTVTLAWPSLMVQVKESAPLKLGPGVYTTEPPEGVPTTPLEAAEQPDTTKVHEVSTSVAPDSDSTSMVAGVSSLVATWKSWAVGASFTAAWATHSKRLDQLHSRNM